MKAKQDFTMRVEGIDELIRKLQALPPRMQRRVLRAGGRAGAGVLRTGARSRLKPGHGLDTGSLKRQIAVKEGDPKKHGGAVVFSIHIAKGSFLVKRDKSGKVKLRKLKGIVAKGMPSKVTPSSYAHLVEKGFDHASGKRVQARPFLRPTMDEDKGKAFSAVAAKSKEAFNKAASELGG